MKFEIENLKETNTASPFYADYVDTLSSFQAMQENCKKLISKIDEKWFLKKIESVKGSFILVEYENGAKKEMILSDDELKVLRYAVLHNYGVVNLLSKVEAIKSLINKGLLELTARDGVLKTTKLVDLIMYNGGTFGYIDIDDTMKNEFKKSSLADGDISNIGWIFFE